MSEQRKKILFVVPSLRNAGAENQLVDVVNCMASDALIEAHLFFFEAEDSLLSRLHKSAVIVHRSARRKKFDFRPAREIAALLRTGKFDVIHCTLRIALLMAWLGRRVAGVSVPIVYVLHSTINKDIKVELWDRAIYQWLMRRCTEVVFVCQHQREYWQDKYPFLRGRGRVIYNGVDTTRFKPAGTVATALAARELFHLPAESIVITCIAGFRPEKRHDVLIDAFVMLVSDGIAAHLVLAGDGSTRRSCEERCAALGIQDHVRFLGNVGDVWPVLAASDVTVLASTAVETFSLAMLESMSMGVPMVATDIGCAKEALIDGVTGYVVAPGRPEALAARLRLLSKDRDHRRSCGINARNLVESCFSRDKMVSNYLALTLDVSGRQERVEAQRVLANKEDAENEG